MIINTKKEIIIKWDGWEHLKKNSSLISLYTVHHTYVRPWWQSQILIAFFKLSLALGCTIGSYLHVLMPCFPWDGTYLFCLRERFINLTMVVPVPLTRYILSWRLLTYWIIIHQNKQRIIKILAVVFDLSNGTNFK